MGAPFRSLLLPFLSIAQLPELQHGAETFFVKSIEMPLL